MEKKKGLCSTCEHDKDCAFPRKFPVWECEEFSDCEPEPMERRKIKKTKEKTK